MKTKTILAATLLMLVASTMPVSAYHITNPVANTWGTAIPFLIICESDGPLDPRNPNALGPFGGNNALCTSGLNAVTVAPASIPLVPPAFGAFTKFDMLDGAGAPNTVGYQVEIGVTFCAVAANQEVRYRELYAWLSYDGPGGPGFHGHVAAFFDPLTSAAAVVGGSGFAATPSAAGTIVCGSTDALGSTPVHLV